MKVTKLNWLSKAAKEAELIVSDGTHECLVFSQPCNVQLNENVIEPLHAMDVENLMKVVDQDMNENIKRTNESYFSHYCVARVVRMDESVVSVGDIIIQLEGAIPSWAKEGDLVGFKCSRLDIW
jgi:hypothetical protein